MPVIAARWRRRLLFGLAVVALLLATLYVFRDALIARPLGRLVAAQLTRHLGGTFSVTRVHGRWLSGAVLEDLRTVTAPPTGALVRLECRRLEVDYSLWRMLRARDVLAGISAISADGVVIDLDLTRARTATARTAPNLTAIPRPQLPALFRPALVITGDVQVQTAAGALALPAFRLDGDAETAAFTVAHASFPGWGLPDERLELQAARVGDGLDFHTVGAIAGVEIAHAHIGDELTLELLAAGGAAGVRVADGAVALRLDALDLARLPAWLRRWSLPDAGVITGRALLGFNHRATANVVVCDFRWREAAFTTASIAAVWDGAELRVDAARADGPGLALALTSARLLPTTPWLVGAERVSATVDDLRPWLALLWPRAARVPQALSLSVSLARAGAGVGEGTRLNGEQMVLGCGASRVALSGVLTLPIAGATWATASIDAQAQTTLKIADFSALITDALPSWLNTALRDGSVDGTFTAQGPLAHLTAVVSVDATAPAAQARLRAHGRWPQWSVDACTLSAGAHTLDATGDITVAVLASAQADTGISGQVTRLHVQTPAAGAIALQAPIAFAWQPGAWRVAPGVLMVGAGRLEFAGALGAEITVEMAAHDLVLDRVLAWLAPTLALRARADGTVSLHGTAAAPVVTVAIDLRGELALANQTAPARTPSQLVSLTLRGGQDARGLRLDELDLKAAGVGFLSAEGAWPAQIGLRGWHELTGAPTLSVDARAAVVDGLVPSGWPVRPAAGCVELHAQLADGVLDGTLVARDIVVPLPVPPPDDDAPSGSTAVDQIGRIDAQLHADTQGVRAQVQLGDDGGLAVSADTTCAVVLDLRRPWTLPTLSDWPLAGAVQLSGIDLTRLLPLLPMLARLDGRIAGAVAVTGSVAAPQVHGRIAVDGLGLKSRSDLPALADGHGAFLIAGAIDALHVTIEDLRAQLGYGPLTLGGTIDLGSEPNRSPILALTLTGHDLLLAQNQYLRLRADLGPRPVTITGPLTRLLVAGDVTITDALYSKPLDLSVRVTRSGEKTGGVRLFTLREAPLSDLRFDLAVHADRSLRIATNVVNTALSADLRLVGTGAVPEPNGRLWCDRGRIDLPFTTLRLERAALVFPPDAPFAPSIEVEANARLRGRELQVRVSGRVPDIAIDVTGSGLSPTEAVRLLTTGRTGADDDPRGTAELAQVGTYLGKELLRTAVGDGDPDAASVLERLSLSVGERVNPSTGTESYDAEFLLTGPFLLHGERDIYAGYNLGVVWRWEFQRFFPLANSGPEVPTAR